MWEFNRLLKNGMRADKTRQNSASASFAKLPHDQLGEVPRIVNALAIHKHRRGSANADFSPVFDILLDQLAAG